MTKANEIPTGELFADLQVSLTEIFLIELLGDEITDDQRSRLGVNVGIREAIKEIMCDRFTREGIEYFLENGYPRSVKLTKI